MARKGSLGIVWLRAYLDEGAPTFLNATASARRAGYNAKDVNSFKAIGHTNRRKYGPKIAEWLDRHGFSETK